MSWLRLWWGWNDRLNRLQFIAGNSLAAMSTLLMFVVVAVCGTRAPNGGWMMTAATMPLIYLPHLLVAPLQASIAVRRAHDLGYSAYALLGACIAAAAAIVLANLLPDILEVFALLLINAMIFWLALYPGQPQANAYGASPPPGWLP